VIALFLACAPAPAPAPAAPPTPPEPSAVTVDLADSSSLAAAASAWRNAPPDGELTLRLTADLTGSLMLDDPFGVGGPAITLEGGGHRWTGGTLAIRGRAVTVRDLVVEDAPLVLTGGAIRVERSALVWSKPRPSGGGSTPAGLALELVGGSPGAAATLVDCILASGGPDAPVVVGFRGRNGASAPALTVTGGVLAGKVQVGSGSSSRMTGGKVVGDAAGIELDPAVARIPWSVGPVPWLAAARARDLGSPVWGGDGSRGG
jgi:hypothetical protein